MEREVHLYEEAEGLWPILQFRHCRGWLQELGLTIWVGFRASVSFLVLEALFQCCKRSILIMISTVG